MFSMSGFCVVAFLLGVERERTGTANSGACSAPPARRFHPRPLPVPPNALQGRIADLPPQWIEQLQDMGPAEQERFLSNNARFRSLPAQRQVQIRRRLRAWNNLPLDQRQAVLERQQIWEQLPPDSATPGSGNPLAPVAEPARRSSAGNPGQASRASRAGWGPAQREAERRVLPGEL